MEIFLELVQAHAGANQPAMQYTHRFLWGRWNGDSGIGGIVGIRTYLSAWYLSWRSAINPYTAR